jgi:hypothetical protein
MISVENFIRLSYSPDLTESGIAYAIRSLPYTYNRMGGSLYSRLRRIVSGVAVELAFRRYLGEQDIPFDVKGMTPFTEPDRYDVSLGGHRCDLKTFVTSKRGQITAMRRNPAIALHAPALIPADQFAGENHSDQDIYLFAFLLGLTTNSNEEIKTALQAGQPIYLIHPMPPEWSRPNTWAPLGNLSLKSECSEVVTIEIGGLDKEREFISQKLSLEPLTRMVVDLPLYSLSYLHTESVPNARIGVHSNTRGEVYLIPSRDWGNIWIYGMETWLTGYITREEFRRKANTIFAGSRVFQYSKTQTKNMSVPIEELRPLPELFERVKEWEGQRSR